MVIVYIIIAVLKCVHHFNERKHWSQVQEIHNLPLDIQSQNMINNRPNQIQERVRFQIRNSRDQNSDTEPGIEPPPSYEDVMKKEKRYYTVPSTPPPSYDESTTIV